MSKDSREEARKVSLNELVLRYNQLKEYINILGSQIDTYTRHLSELQLVLDTLKNIPEKGSSALVTLDRLNTLFLPVNIVEEWSSKVVINIGRNYYMKTTRDKAVEIINKRLNNIRRILNDLQKQYQLALNEYNALQQLLSSIYVQQIEKQEKK